MAHIVRVEPYCVLCREGLLNSNEGAKRTSTAAKNNEPWMSDVICFFDQSTTKQIQHEPRYKSFRANLSEPFWILGHRLSEWSLDLSDNPTCFSGSDCPECALKKTANLVHASCVQVARQVVPKLCIKKLATLAQVARPIMPWRQMVTIMGSEQPRAVLPSASILSRTTDLGALVHSLQSRLPAEVQNIIATYVSGLFRTLSNCLSTLDYAAGSLKMLTPSAQVYQPFGDLERLRKIGLETVNVLGETCLARVIPELCTSEDEDAISCHDMTGLQLAIGRYGVTALRWLQKDGSDSSWLGGGRRKWFMTYRGEDLKLLRACSDGFKLLRMGLESEHKSSNSPQAPYRMLWDQEKPPSESSHIALIDVVSPSSDILGNPQLRLGQYLSLTNECGEVQSLTMYCTSQGVCCIQVNQDPSRRLGQQWAQSCALTVYFELGEAISTIHGLTKGSKNAMLLQGPYLIVGTSNGRTVLFGPQAFPSMPDAHISDFGSPQDGRVSGMFSDPSTFEPKRFATIGLITEPSQPSSTEDNSLRRPITVPLLSRVSREPFHRRYCRSSFMTKANLLNVKSLRVQRKEDRCVGMLINRHGGTTEPLGQWDPCNVVGTSVLYDHESSSEPLSSLTFVFSDDSRDDCERYIKDIRVGSAGADVNDDHYTWTELEQELAWWFTFRYDHLEPWNGDATELRVSDDKLHSMVVQ